MASEDAKEALKGIDVRLNTQVASLDLAGKAVVLEDGTAVPYDHLVLSLGVVGDPSAIEGMSDALDMYSYADVARQEKELAEIVSRAKAGEKQTLCIAIGAAPYKARGKEWVCGRGRERGRCLHSSKKIIKKNQTLFFM